VNGTCQNCKQPLPESPRVFQGVIICHDCFKIVSHYIQRTQNELKMLFTVYTDMLRVALVKGELRPPPAPPPGKEMPPKAFSDAFKKMAERFGGLHGQEEKGTDGEGQVSELRLDDGGPSGGVPGGRHDQALPGR